MMGLFMSTCDHCGRRWSIDHLDAKPAHLAGPPSWIIRLFPKIRIKQLTDAADRGFDFETLEGPCCYGPGYAPGA